MMHATTAELAARVGGRLAGDGVRTVRGVAIDSREVGPGSLFVALPGEHVDGHDFVAAAAKNGAGAALVHRPLPHALPQVVVEDTLRALQSLAAQERRRHDWRVAAITGSLAKTTTKEFLAHLLASQFTVGKTAGSRNSQAGFPAEVCNQPDSLDWLVAELGMSRPGELDRLGGIARPDLLLYTVIAPVHLEFFADLEGIAAAKAELIPHLDAAGVLVLNAADARVRMLADRFAGRVVTYGAPGASDLWAEVVEDRGLMGSTIRLATSRTTAEVNLSIPGRHQVDNLVAATAAALAAGGALPALATAASRLRAPRHRGEVHHLANGITLVDDCYNASPVAMARLLELLAASPGRRVAVLGEMRELGPTALQLHRHVGEQAARCADLLVAVGGPLAGALAAAAGPSARHLPDVASAVAHLPEILRPGDVVLVKGSRGVGLDQLVDTLLPPRER